MSARLLLWLGLAALLVGVVLDVLTWVLARSGPEGGAGAAWSLLLPLAGILALIGFGAGSVRSERHVRRPKQASALLLN